MAKKKSRAENQAEAIDAMLKAGKPVTEKKKKGPKQIFLICLVCLCLVLLIVCGLGIWGGILTRSDVNFPNVTVGDINVGGLTQTETLALLEQEGWEERVDGVLTVSLPAEVEIEIGRCISGAELSAKKAAEAAYAAGRSGGWFENLFSWLRMKLVPTDVNRGERVLNQEYLSASIQRGAELVHHATRESGYEMDKARSRITLTKGAGEISLDEQALYQAITEALSFGEEELHFEELASEIMKPDFKALHDKIHIEAANAYYDEEFNVVPEVQGLSFDALEAELLWEKAKVGEEIVIPLVITQPEYTEAMLSQALFRDRLGGMTTSYKWSTNERVSNIKLAAEKIDKLVLLPGESFSFNETVGQRTEEAGFQLATAYSDGQEVDAIGGGICQVSSTLYSAQMYAQLKTTSRVNHYFKVNYVDYGMDATVSWKKPDYKFTNSREYPVMISAWCDDESQTLTVEIWGTDTDGSYVKIRTTSAEIYDETWTDTLIGYTVRAYRDIYDKDGNVINTISEPGGAYYFHDEDIDWPEEKKLAEQDPVAALEQFAQQQEQGDEGGGYLFEGELYEHDPYI